MNEIEKLKTHLKQAMAVAKANISKAENIDLEDMYWNLDSFITELNNIGDFESYGDDDDDEELPDIQEIAERLIMQKRAGIITEGQYIKKLKEAEMDNISPEKAVDKAIAVAPKLEKSPEVDKLANKIANDPSLLKQLEKALAQGGIMMNENLKNLDNNDMKTLALNLAKKAEKINEGFSNNPEADDVSAGLGMLAFFGGGTLGAMFSSAIGAAIPALTTLFAGPAVAAALTGVALFIVARKVFLLMNPDL